MGSYDKSRELFKFVSDPTISLNDFLFSGESLTLPQPANDLTDDQLKHEACHAEAWSRLGIASNYYKDNDGTPYTAPNYDDVKSYVELSGISKEQFIDLYEQVVSAPREIGGFELTGTDLRDDKILKREFKTMEEVALFTASNQ